MIGILLAGGAGRRLGGGKPARLLAGRPLAAYPAAALVAVCERVAVVAKPGTELPELSSVERWDDEPAEPRHPLTGIVHALRRAGGEAVLVCAADMPFVTPAALRALTGAGGDAVAVADGVLQPVLAVYTPEALPTFRAAAPDAPLTRTIERLDPARVPLPPSLTCSVDTREELAAAETRLSAAGLSPHE